MCCGQEDRRKPDPLVVCCVCLNALRESNSVRCDGQTYHVECWTAYCSLDSDDKVPEQQYMIDDLVQNPFKHS